MDCSKEYGNDGCNGGEMWAANEYLLTTGLELEIDYPYTAKDGECKKKLNEQVRLESYTNCTENSGASLAEGIDQGAVSVSVDAGSMGWMYYHTGILDEIECGITTEVDHAITALGYVFDDESAAYPYWILENSWGADWGENGYIRLEAKENGRGACGINWQNYYPGKVIKMNG